MNECNVLKGKVNICSRVVVNISRVTYDILRVFLCFCGKCWQLIRFRHILGISPRCNIP